MKFVLEREKLLKPLQLINSPIIGRPTLPILGNILLQVIERMVIFTTTDLEIEMISRISLNQNYELGATTVSARKFLDICRGLPEKSVINVVLENDRLLVYSQRIRFSLATLSPNNFPNLDNWQSQLEFTLSHITLKRLIESTQFSMAQQDVRYCLNGMMFETEGKELRTVATDGHRLAVCCMPIQQTLPKSSVIVPRKGVIELSRLLNNDDKLLRIQIGNSNIRVHVDNFTFTSKLIGGTFPDYRRVLPKITDKFLEANCDLIKKAFTRVAIISNEKFRSVRIYLTTNQIKITANNPDQGEAEEILEVRYLGSDLEMGFNVNYIIDVLNVLKCERVRFLLTDSNSSIQIEDVNNQIAIYVVMPIRL
ncbi:DNA polymerase III subunit beta [Pantoea sp. Mhis]|uniref:DNA polymerase III subunit beta n=1 Tax=Pantoea sp. Mhis TaxID=2576759 RepID=UPI001358E3AD|nr:DNA polymerase III subunit beta [Pantoea sp. Mhis]MXP56734.1 DNA polymerase III subunit beta [Pantoea sp. Mhis]